MHPRLRTALEVIVFIAVVSLIWMAIPSHATTMAAHGVAAGRQASAST
jgi:hypothetical protein